MAAAAEIQFAQRLASNEKRFRDRAVRKLRRYLSARSQRLSEFLFMETFFQTMNREWNGIDRLRLDKFYMLIRLVLRQFLEELKSMSWDDSVVSRFLSCVTKEVLNPSSNSAASGIRFHFIDIYLQELAKVGAQQLSAEQNLKFIDPFCRIAAKTKDRVLFHAVSQGIFEMISDQAPFAIEDLMNELQYDEQEGSVCEELDSSSKGEEDQTATKASPEINGSTSENGDELLVPDREGERPNHSGYDDDFGPVLQFNYAALADRLFQLSSRGSTPAQNRKRLYKLVKKFRDLAEGIFPQDDFPQELSTDEEDEDFCKRKRKKKWRLKNVLEEQPEDKRKAGKGQKRKRNCSMQKLQPVSDGNKEAVVENGKESNSTELLPVRIKKNKSRAVKTMPLGDPVHANTSEITIQTPESSVCGKQLCPAVLGAQLLASDVDSVTLATKPKKGKKRQTQDASGSHLPEETAASEPVVGKKVKKMLMRLGKLQAKRQAAGDQPSPKQGPGRRKRKEKGLPEGATSSKKLKIKSSGDAEPCVGTQTLNAASSEFLKFQSSPIPKPIFLKKAKSAETVRKRCKMIKIMSTSSAKKVRFGLRKNMTAEFKRTDKSILVSPEGRSRIAFDPEQRPHHSVLKSNSTPTCSPLLRARRTSMSARGRPQAMDSL
ncbi:ribosomal RNA processing protein 1 homolog B isoform X4 [Mustelus asterias]